MPRKVQLFQTSDWSGGLNKRDDAFQLGQNELADCVNMEVSPQGGIQRRPGLLKLNTTNAVLFGGIAVLRNVWTFYGAASPQIVVSDNRLGSDADYSTDGGLTWTAINPDALTITTSAIPRAAAAQRAATGISYLFVQRDIEQKGWVWDGVNPLAITDPATGFYNENLAAPAGSTMPVARFLTTHIGYMFHAYTKEAGVTYKNRLRFSHPGEPADYRALDYIDVGDDSDVITGLASYEDRLYIFKHRAIWMLTGYDADTFQVTKVAEGTGAATQEAITVSRYGIAFFDERQGVFLIQGNKPPVWLWEKMADVMRTEITPTALTKTRMGWFGHKLFCSIVQGTAYTVTPSHTYVYDSTVGKSGTWYRHDYGLGCMTEYYPTDLPVVHIACNPRGPNLLSVDVATTIDDDTCAQAMAPTTSTAGGLVTMTTTFDSGLVVGDTISVTGMSPSGYNQIHAVVTEVPVPGLSFKYQLASGTTPGAFVSGANSKVVRCFPSYFQTAWYAAGTPGVRKRWRRPTFIMDNEVLMQLGVSIYRDYSVSTVARQFSVTNDPTSAGMIWDVDDWGDAPWGAAGTGGQAIQRGSGLGRAYAIQIKVTATTLSTAWGLNAIELRYIPGRIR